MSNVVTRNAEVPETFVTVATLFGLTPGVIFTGSLAAVDGNTGTIKITDNIAAPTVLNEITIRDSTWCGGWNLSTVGIQASASGQYAVLMGVADSGSVLYE
jgi:hypothetical protein